MTLRGTPAQVAALDALIEWGTPKAAAHSLDLSYRAFQWRIQRLCEQNCMTTVQLAAKRGRRARRAA